VTELIASGPLRYLGGSIETFALPMGTFIVIALILFYIYRRPHDVPRLKYLRPAHQVALGTREPGSEGLVYIASATAASATATPEAEAEAEEAEAPAETAAAAETTQADAGTAAEATAEAPAETEAAAEAEAHVSSAAPAAESEVTADAEHDGTTAEGETF
jgi:hypothetical protein